MLEWLLNGCINNYFTAFGYTWKLPSFSMTTLNLFKNYFTNLKIFH